MKASETQVAGKHYVVAIQPFQFSLMNELSGVEHTIHKYIVRARQKNGKQDIDKAIHCVQLLIEWMVNPAYPQLQVIKRVKKIAEYLGQFKLGIHEKRAAECFLFAIGSSPLQKLMYLEFTIDELKLAKHSYKKGIK